MRHARVLAALLLGSLLPGGAAAGTRVMSIGLCADQYVLALLPPRRIASVTWLARDAASPAVAAAARKVGVNHQSAEEVLRQRPGLVVADAFSDPATKGMLKRLGVPMIELPYASDFATIRAATLMLGKAADALPRARVLAAKMDAALASLAVSPVPGRPRVAAWDGSGSLPPKGSLYDAAITAAGARNVGREAARRGGFRTEALLASRPDFLLHDDKILKTSGRQADLVGHPLARRLYRNRQITIPQEQFVCGTPATVGAAVQLNRDLRRAASPNPQPPFALSLSKGEIAPPRGPRPSTSSGRTGVGG